MSTWNYKAMFVPAVGGSTITVTVSANSSSQATKLIEQLYGPVKWYSHPVRQQKKPE